MKGFSKLCGLHLVILLAAACGGDDEESPLTRSEFCAKWAERACTAETVSVCQASSPEACQASQQQACLNRVPTGFVDEHTDECLVAVEAAYEDADLTADEMKTVLFLQDPCDRLASGSGTEGASCSTNADCDTTLNLECVIKSSDGGTCQTPEEAAAGFECSAPNQVCEDGFFCDGNNCIAAKSVGSACTRNAECSVDAYCNVDTCESRAAVGTTCTANEQCLSEVCFEVTPGEKTCTDRLRLSPSQSLCNELK